MKIKKKNCHRWVKTKRGSYRLWKWAKSFRIVEQTSGYSMAIEMEYRHENKQLENCEWFDYNDVFGFYTPALCQMVCFISILVLI